MKKFSVCLIVALASVAACGDDGDGNNPDSRPRIDAGPTIDSPPQVDAPPACTQIALGPQQFAQNSGGAALWFVDIETDLGDGGPAFLQFEFYDGFRPGGVVGTWDLTDAIDGNYATCATCLHAVTLNEAQDAVVRHFFQASGQATITEDPWATFRMTGSLDGVTLVEVTIDSETFESTPVPGGECLTFTQPYTLAGTDLPAEWTCAAGDWRDGTTCNCVCGAPDPDCDPAGNTVMGCAAGQECVADACVDAPANDTCETSIAITVGTPRNGTTVDAANHYNNGLEGATCTGFGQPGGDVAYRVNLTAGTSYDFRLFNLAPAMYDPAIALIPADDPTCSADPLGCLAGADAGGAGAEETFTFTPTTSGSYRVIVDSFYPAGDPRGAGTFRLSVTAN